VSRLTEQIGEAEAAHQAAKAARNEAQDKRKEAWKLETELKDQVNKATAEYDRAFSVSVLEHRVKASTNWPHIHTHTRGGGV
jgi:hypothetical protein